MVLVCRPECAAVTGCLHTTSRVTAGNQTAANREQRIVRQSLDSGDLLENAREVVVLPVLGDPVFVDAVPEVLTPPHCAARRLAAAKLPQVCGAASVADRDEVAAREHPPAMMRAYYERYGLRVIHAWGMTETSPLGSVAPAVERDRCGGMGLPCV